MSSCKEIGKQLSQQYYLRPNISAAEIKNPETVIAELIGLHGDIQDPKVYSPKKQYEVLTRGKAAYYYSISSFQNEPLLDKKGVPLSSIAIVIQGLVTDEKVARRQYDELLMFPELSKFVPDLLYIRNDEHEHEKILECIMSRVLGSAQPAAAKPTPLAPAQKSVTLTPKAVGELYETMLDRFGDEEEKSVNSYEELLVKVQSSMKALINARMQKNMSMESYQEAIVPLNELERKINKHLNEERVHLDVIDAMREMFTNMKLGNVY
jgi:hypothetical protein